MRRANAVLLPLLLAAAWPAHAYKLLGSAWDADRGPVLFHLEPSGSDDVSDGSDLDAVRSAFRRWSCVVGSRLRFVEGDVVGAKEAESGDGRNSVFWDEDGTYGLGVATLGVTLGPASDDPENLVERTWSTIVFNGVDHTWSVRDELAVADETVDVESIAVHEAGHWLGLGHPCEDAEETVCKGPDEAVMHPTYPGGLLRELRDDDEDGARALYPQDDDSTCEGPYRQGERCSCNDECTEGLLCVPVNEGDGVCAPPCSSENGTCPGGFACVLTAPSDDGSASGLCRKSAGGAPPGALCERDDQCAEGLCARADAVGRTVCRLSCDVDDDCPAEHACASGACLSSANEEGLTCGMDDGGCACANSDGAAPPWLLLALLGLVALRIRFTHSRLNQATSERHGVAYSRPTRGGAGRTRPEISSSVPVGRSEGPA